MCVKNDYIRIVSELEGLAVEVLTITWSGPHTPEDEWVVAKVLEEPCSAAELEEAIKQVLADTRYFGFCRRCNEYSLEGHMHNEDTCSSCAEKHLGIVY